ncbi:FMN-binding glutamate synthase family protein [Pedobacter sp. BS3]|uniref:FMN-binding glutamate synthase family protein n=1 Tax=Pedobacter sp. BS3 TaxID=2567937 RepID=UPI0011EE6E13|nr:FMN-binding glutamate synthase family protein [Pedobacter sp. BS3]TZF84714.1 FMN-binding glutamate synthase family protein [Pedobacter sp. BS3]
MRRTFLVTFVVLILAVFVWSLTWRHILWSFIIIIPVLAVGIYDLVQKKHSILRNFPLVGHLRYLMEDLRPKLYQYFVESDTDGMPFNRIQRDVMYQRAKKVDDTKPFGTELDVYANGYEWLNHSIAAIDHKQLDEDPRVLVGGPQCMQPYKASVLNISAMSFGSLSKNAILALNSGAKIGNFAHNTGEGGLSDYHLQPGGDIFWQIGTGYFGCRNLDGTFNEEAFKERAAYPQVKMIEIKLSQGAKPGHGGILPAAKVTEEIARIRLVHTGADVVSPPAHSAFSTPLEMVQFIDKLRRLSGGKPIGFKLCIGNKSEFIAICKAMVKTGIYADFITVDGGEGGTGAAPMEFSNAVGMPLREALSFVSDTLLGFDLKKHIRVIASGKVVTGFDLVKNIALGADMCNSARGMMFALGCIQALECNRNTCPTGVATQNPSLTKGLVVADKKVRVANFHRETVNSAVQLMGAAGIRSLDDLKRHFIYRRVGPGLVKTYAEIYPYIPVGSLLQSPYPATFEYDMAVSTETSFLPLSNVEPVDASSSSPYMASS